MKLITRILVLLALTVLAASCRKETERVAPEQGMAFPQTEIVFDADCPEVDLSDGTKVIHSLDSSDDNKHLFQWKKGDQFSLLGYVSDVGDGTGGATKNNLINFSENRYTLVGEDGTKRFHGWFPNWKAMFPITEGVSKSRTTVQLFGVHPPVTFTCDDPNNGKLDKAVKPVVENGVSTMVIADKQDGSGWKYAWYVCSPLPTNDPRYNSGVGQPRTDSFYLGVNGVRFRLGVCMARLKLKTGRPLAKINIVKTEDEWQGFVGPVSSMSLTYYGFSIGGGCRTRTLDLEKEDGSPLVEADAAGYTDVYFACRGLFKDKTYTFTFIADNGSTCVKTFKPSQDYKDGVWNLGEFSLDEWGAVIEPASVAAKNMGMGVSVGAFEAVTATTENLPERADENGMHILDRYDPITYETNGSKDPVTQKMMDTLHESGFSCIRFPATWFNHMDGTMGPIDRVWLEHMRSRIDMATHAGMYSIINIHHDAGTYDFCWLKADWANYSTISAQLKNIWAQIADYFKDYDYHLLFEGYNEIADENNRWWRPGSSDGFKAANALNQDFVDVVRASGGNNTVRNLIVSTYTASEWQEALQGFTLPKDRVSDHLLVQVHSYRPNEFVTAREVGDRSRMDFYESDKPEIDEVFQRLQVNILDKGWPCVLGEYGAFFKRDAQGNRHDEDRGAHAYYYTMSALRKGIVPIYWYNPMNYRDRDAGRWTHPILADSLMKAWRDFQAEQLAQ